MAEMILLGRGNQIIEVPRGMWQGHLSQAVEHTRQRISFMTDNHHRVRNFVVVEIPRQGVPISPDIISTALNLSLQIVVTILEDLERNLFFLVRDDKGAVNWAFPVTTDLTPHRLKFSTGETIFAAGAEDAIATPFVQGSLRKKALTVTIDTKCAQSGQPINLTLDNLLETHIHTGGANPFVFLPNVDWEQFEERTIIDAFGRNSVFFWSEEHLRKHRANTEWVDGTYLTLPQAAYVTRFSQGALFALD